MCIGHLRNVFFLIKLKLKFKSQDLNLQFKDHNHSSNNKIKNQQRETQQTTKLQNSKANAKYVLKNIV